MLCAAVAKKWQSIEQRTHTHIDSGDRSPAPKRREQTTEREGGTTHTTCEAPKAKLRLSRDNDKVKAEPPSARISRAQIEQRTETKEQQQQNLQ